MAEVNKEIIVSRRKQAAEQDDEQADFGDLTSQKAVPLCGNDHYSRNTRQAFHSALQTQILLHSSSPVELGSCGATRQCLRWHTAMVMEAMMAICQARGAFIIASGPIRIGIADGQAVSTVVRGTCLHDIRSYPAQVPALHEAL